MYSNILGYVVSKKIEAEIIHENFTADTSTKNENFDEIEDMRLTFGENSNSAVIRISGSNNKLGKILGASDEVVKLGYKPEELIGEPINILIPPILAEIHGEIMKNYFKTGKSKIVNHQISIYPLDKHGFISPYISLVRIVPSLAEGIQMIMFLRPDKNTSAVDFLKSAKEKSAPRKGINLPSIGEKGLNK